jgi:hypothetical protein
MGSARAVQHQDRQPPEAAGYLKDEFRGTADV